MSMTATKAKPREVVSANDLRVGDTLIGNNGYDLTITKITDKPKTRVLHIEDTIGGIFEDDYRVRRTTEVYIRQRKCYSVQALIESYGPVIQDEDYADNLEEAHAIGRRYLDRDADETHWVEIVECEYPGKEHPEIEYLDHVETMERP